MFEALWHDWLQANLPTHPRLALGFGDDAAVADWRGDPHCVLTSDLLADGVHFRSGQHAAERIGHKALAVNLSDIAAMAAIPRAATISLLLPNSCAKDWVAQLYSGIFNLAAEYDVAIAGGDTNCWDGQLVISITVVGQLTQRGKLTRSGARPGDAILVTGPLGGSFLGRHLDFKPRVQEAIALHRDYRIHAAMDLSDGLTLDLARLAAASHSGAELTLNTIPIAAAARELALATANSTGEVRDELELEQVALGHALSDGEDFELLLVTPPDVADRMLDQQPEGLQISRVGEMVAEQGLWHRGPDGRRLPLPANGYLH
jgi:thiamine-monophosphate kinase